MKDLENHDIGEDLKGVSLPDSAIEPHRHPLGAGIGAVLAAGTAGATGGVLVGPIGAVVGAVVGAVAGGLGGSAIAELVDPAPSDDLDDLCIDSYITRLHVHSPADDEEETEAISSHRPDLKPASREAWSLAEPSSKELLTDNPPSDDA